VISKSNPQCLLTEDYNVDPEALYMDANYFLFIFSLENMMTNNFLSFVDESIYKVDALVEMRTNGTFTYIPVEVMICDESHIPNNNPELKDYLIKNNYQNMYCFQNYSDVLMKGTWDSQVFYDIKIQIRPCNNITDNNTCQSQEVISNVLDGGYLKMFYTSIQTDLTNYDNPVKISATNDFQPANPQLATELYLYFGRMNVKTDIGIFLEDFIYQEGVNLVYNKFTLYQNMNQTNPFLTVYLRLDTTIINNTRKYDNILDVLSKVGGLLRILTIIGSLFLKHFFCRSDVTKSK